MVKMSIGARDAVDLGEQRGLMFRVGPGRYLRKVRIMLTPMDTYDVTCVRATDRLSLDTVEEFRHDGAYAEDLGAVLLRCEREVWGS